MVRKSSNKRCKRCSQSQDGTVAIMVAIMLVMLLAFGSFVVDVGYMFRTRGELQNAVDSAALAGAKELNLQNSGLSRACAMARTFSSSHEADNTPVTIFADEDIELGRWYFEDADAPACGTAPCFERLGDCSAPDSVDHSQTNAMRVIARRAQSDGNQLKLFLGAFIGSPEADVVTDAIAVGGGSPSTECPFPLVVPECQLLNPTSGSTGSCQWCMTFHSSNDDSAGWSPLSTDAGASQCSGTKDQPIYDLIVTACGQSGEGIDANGRCSSCSSVNDGPQVDEKVQVCNGNNLNTSGNGNCQLIEDILMRTGTAKAFQVSSPVLGSEGYTWQNCSDFNFAGRDLTVTGYATMTIYGVKCGNAANLMIDSSEQPCSDMTDPTTCPNQDAACTLPPSDKYILAKLDCNAVSNAPDGGLTPGTSSHRSRLVE